MKVTLLMTTTIGAHGMAGRTQAEAWSRGLSCTLITTGGWFEKHHRFDLSGPDAAVQSFKSVFEENLP